MKNTLVIGASTKPERYAYKAANRLIDAGYNVTLVGRRRGEIAGNTILTGFPPLKNIHTVTLYIGPQNQAEWYDYIIELKPERIIFNPGTENDEFQKRLEAAKIPFEEACTLVLLSLNQY